MKVTEWIAVYLYDTLLFVSDIDECQEGSAGCDHNCVNTDGSYLCTCMDGYELESDNHTCTGDDLNKAVYMYMYLSLALR